MQWRRLIGTVGLSGALLVAWCCVAQAAPKHKARHRPSKTSVTITGAQVCSLLTAPEIQALLNGTAASGPGTPQTPPPARCAWATAAGADFSMSVGVHPTGYTGCNGLQGGTLVHMGGWTGCFLSHGMQQMSAYEGRYLIEIDPDLTGTLNYTPAKEEAAEKAALTHAFKELHA